MKFSLREPAAERNPSIREWLAALERLAYLLNKFATQPLLSDFQRPPQFTREERNER